MQELVLIDGLIVLGCAWGLSGWLPGFEKSAAGPALWGLVGVQLLLLLFLFLFVWPGMSLSLATKIIAVVAGCGAVRFGILHRGGLADLPRPGNLLHPLWLCLPVALVTAATVDHQLTRIDELTHWVLMPYQYDSAGTVRAEDLPSMTFADYTPGLPLLCVFAPVLRGNRFEAGGALAPSLVLGCLILGAIYELVLAGFQQRSDRRDTAGFPMLALLMTAFLASVRLVGTAFPHYVLIEPSKMGMVTVLGLLALLCWRERDEKKRFNWAVQVGLALAVVYLLKKPMLFAAPGVFVLALCCFRRLRDGRVWLVLWLPLAATYGVWAWMSAPFPQKWQMTAGGVDHVAVLLSAEAGRLLGDMVVAVGGLFLHPTNGFFLLISGLLLYHARPAVSGRGWRLGIVVAVCWLPLMLLWGLLFWMYLFVFADWERDTLASFQRYSQVFLRPAAAVLLVVGLWEKGGSILRWTGPTTMRRLGRLSVLVLLVLPMQPILKERGRRDPILNQSAPRFFLELKRFTEQEPTVLLVTGPSVDDFYRVRFASCMNHKTRFQLSPAFHFVRAKEAAHHYSTVIDEPGMLFQLQNHDILWIQQADPWIERLLLQLKPYPQGPLVFRPASGSTTFP